jgi:ACR3 family arsenite transporter
MSQNYPGQGVLTRLSWLDRLLPVWIFLAMGAGVLFGHLVPGIGPVLASLQVDSVSLPIALGLIWMIYPPLAAVDYQRMSQVVGARRVVTVSLLLNWLVGPFLMFGLALLLLPGLPALQEGVILVGLARCIAMVLIWNQLAGGNNEHAAVLVALNAVFQIVTYSAYAYLFLAVLTPHLVSTVGGVAVSVDPGAIALNVAVFLGIPLTMGFLTRTLLVRRKGVAWYQTAFLRRVQPTALLALLFTLVVMFALEGNALVLFPVTALRVAAPLLAYFLLMFLISYLLSWKLGFSYRDTATTAFTASSNNFELAIAVAVATFGLTSSQAFATVVGPLIEVPVMIGLVYLSLALRNRLFPAPPRLRPGLVTPGERPRTPRPVEGQP